MMGTKNQPGKWDCYQNAMPDEPMFILLARDPSAPDLVEDWATQRTKEIAGGRRPSSDEAMVDEAISCAANMRHWRVVNNGAWREQPAAAPVLTDEMVLAGAKAANPFAWETNDEGKYNFTDSARQAALDEMRQILIAALSTAAPVMPWIDAEEGDLS
jgi:hypothetical protein